MAKASVIDFPRFNVEQDAQDLRNAMKGMGTNEEEIISIVCARSYTQLTEIDKTYKQMFGRILVDDLKSELSGSFEKVILRLFLSDAGKDAHTLKQAVKGLGTDETAIIEIMCTSNNEELAAVKAAYQKEFKNELMKDLIGDTSGDFKRLLVSMSAGDRDQNGPDLSPAEAKDLAKKLYDAGEAKLGTDEEAFNVVLARRGFHQLKSIFHAYQQHFNKEKGILGAIQSEFSGSIREAYLAIATTALEGREAYFADKLHQSMKGLGTKDNQLIRLVTSRSYRDLKTIEVHYLKRHGTTLEEAIAGDTSGDYRLSLLKLTIGNRHS